MIRHSVPSYIGEDGRRQNPRSNRHVTCLLQRNMFCLNYSWTSIISVSSKKIPGFSLMNFQNSRIFISNYFQIETNFDAIAENSSCSEYGHKKTLLCIVVHTIIWASNGLPLHLQPSSPQHTVCLGEHNIRELIYNRLAIFFLGPIKFPDFSLI